MEIISLMIFWQNAIPLYPPIAGDLIPQQIITGMMVDYVNKCWLHFGEYYQVHESHDNTIQASVMGAITLRPTGNAQGEY